MGLLEFSNKLEETVRLRPGVPWWTNWPHAFFFWFFTLGVNLGLSDLRRGFRVNNLPESEWQALIFHTPLVNDIVIFILIWAIVTGCGKRHLLQALNWAWPRQARTYHWRGIPLRSDYASILISVLTGIIIYLFLLALLWWKPSLPTPLDEKLKSSQYIRHMFSLTAVVTAPFVEELLYRGVLWGAFERTWGKRWAILASVFPFVFVHLDQYEGSIIAIVIVTTLALICALVRTWTNRLSLAFLVHLSYNSCMGIYVVFFYPNI